MQNPSSIINACHICFKKVSIGPAFRPAPWSSSPIQASKAPQAFQPECGPSQNNRAALPAGEIALPAYQKNIGIHRMQAFRCIWPCNALTW